MYPAGIEETHLFPSDQLTNVITRLVYNPETGELQIYFRNYFGGNYWERVGLTKPQMDEVSGLQDLGRTQYLYGIATSSVDFGTPDREGGLGGEIRRKIHRWWEKIP